MIEPFAGFVFLAADADADEGTFNPVLPVLSEIIWVGLFFFALWALMKFVLLGPIIEGRNARRAKVSAGADSVSDADAELAQLRAVHEERLSEARSEASSILDSARVDVEAERSQAVAEVEANIAKLKANAQAEIAAARTQALAGAKASVSDLALGAAGKVLGRSVDATAGQAAIDRYLEARSN